MWFTLFEWEVKATQRMVHSTTELITVLLTSNNIVDSNHTSEMQATDKYIEYAVTALISLSKDSLDAVENVFRLTKSADKRKWLAALMCASFTELLVVHLYGKDWRDSIAGSIQRPCGEGDCGTRSHLRVIMRKLELWDDDGLWDLLEMTLDGALVVCSFLDGFQDTGLSASVVFNRVLRSKKKETAKNEYALGLTHSRRICHLILLISETLIRLVNMQMFVNAYDNPSIEECDVWESGRRVKVTSIVPALMKVLDENSSLSDRSTCGQHIEKYGQG